MIHDVASASLSTGGSAVGTVSGQTINGLVLWASAAWDPLDNLTVVLKTPNKPAVVLANNLSMRTIAEVSDLEGGFSQTARAALAAETGDSQILFPCALPLGCVVLGANQSELEITLRKGAGSSVQCGFGTYIDEDRTDELFQYTETRDSRERLGSVVQAWIVANADLVAWNTKSASVMVTSPFGSTVAQVPTLLAYSMAKLSGEWQSPLRVVQAYSSPDPISDNVEVSITGTDASSFTLLARQSIVDPHRVSKGTIAAVDRLQSRLGQKTPGEQKALQRAGVAMSPMQLAIARAKMNSTPSGV